MIRQTKSGYPLNEVVSALQKSIRRSDEEAAMYWALEMCPRFEAYLWRRLLVIVNEDIGLAGRDLLLLVPTLRATYFEMRAREGGSGESLLPLANAILSLCRSPKSRLSVHFANTVQQDALHGLHREIPDYALDQHTDRGRALGRGEAFFRAEAGRLEPPPALDDPYEDRCYAYVLPNPDWKTEHWPPRKGKSDDDTFQPSLFS